MNSNLTPGRTRAVPLVAGAAAVLVALTGCASSTSGSGSPAGSSGGGSAAAAGGSSASAAAPADDLAGLTAAVGSAITKASSVHLTISTSGASAAAAAGNGQGDVTLSGGKATALSFDAGSGAATFSIVYVDGTGYVKLPGGSDPAKPWTEVSADSSDPTIAALAKSFDQIQQQAALNSYSDLLGAASDFTKVGSTDVDGTPATEYDFTVDPSKLPTTSGTGSQFGAAGITSIPTKFYVDDQNRPVKVSESVPVAGQSLTIDVGFSKYDAHVTISAPPADQVTTG